jgi:hypothetical protein
MLNSYGISKKIIIDCLVQAGYLNKARVLQLKVILADPEFTKLDRRFSLCHDPLKTLFNMNDPKKPINKKSKGIDDILTALTSKPPKADLLMQALVKAGFASVYSKQGKDGNNFDVRQENIIAIKESCDPMLPVFREQLLEAVHVIDSEQVTNVVRWFFYIQETLITQVAHKQKIQQRRYLTDYPDSYTARGHNLRFYKAYKSLLPIVLYKMEGCAFVFLLVNFFYSKSSKTKYLLTSLYLSYQYMSKKMLPANHIQ